ncbi:MAG: methylmalonyl-CoA mutase, partial [Bacteroidetes bacterium SW_10_40_5]
GATDKKAQMLRFHSQTGGSTLTAKQPMNNIPRVTNQAMSAVLGGTNSLHTNGYDEALSLPTEEAAQLALRTQQIIAYESGAPDTVDPLAGSYFVETLTNQVEEEAWKYIEKIDEMGGSTKAIEDGYLQNEIANAAYKYQKDMESGEKVIVGVNKFISEEEQEIDLLHVDDAIRQKQVEKIEEVKKYRNDEAVNKALQAIEQASVSDENMMPYLIDAVEAYATLGEIVDAMKKEFGEYT